MDWGQLLIKSIQVWKSKVKHSWLWKSIQDWIWKELFGDGIWVQQIKAKNSLKEHPTNWFCIQTSTKHHFSIGFIIRWESNKLKLIQKWREWQLCFIFTQKYFLKDRWGHFLKRPKYLQQIQGNNINLLKIWSYVLKWGKKICLKNGWIKPNKLKNSRKQKKWWCKISLRD